MSQWQMPPQYGPTVQRPVVGYPPMAPPLKQNGVGIASFVLAILTGVSFFVLLVVAGLMENNTPGGVPEDSPQSMIIGLVAIGLCMLTLLGAILGVAGLFLSDRRKLFAGLGLLLNALVILGIVGLAIVGMMIS